MRFISYRAGHEKAAGVMDGDDRFAPVAAPAGEGSALRRLLAADALRAAGAAALARPDRIALDAVALLPLIPDPAAIWCAAGTYRAHLAEGGHKETSEPPWFLRVAESLCAAGDPIVRPNVSNRLDFEGELAVIIGKRARHVSEADAMAHVAGFTCFNDGSIRDWQVHSTQITPGKNFASTGALGPWLVTPDAFGDPYEKRLETRLNGAVVQSASIGELMFTIERMIAYLSTICPLLPGDVIATGTCAGVGNRRTPQLFMQPGDRIEVEIEGLGILANPIVQESD